jgi:mRNA-degrading endonuclease RelE of RelBE toxin-antitoxin system
MVNLERWYEFTDRRRDDSLTRDLKGKPETNTIENQVSCKHDASKFPWLAPFQSILLCIIIRTLLSWIVYEDRSPVRQKSSDRSISSETAALPQLYLFIELDSFTDDWADLKLSDDELWALEDEIARSPTRAPVVPGGGGARKLRCSFKTSGKGKSGGYRVLYAFLPIHGTVLLISAWPKSEREDLHRSDYITIGKIISRIHSHMDERSNK